MSDNKLSLDDILYEYSKKHKDPEDEMNKEEVKEASSAPDSQDTLKAEEKAAEPEKVVKKSERTDEEKLAELEKLLPKRKKFVLDSNIYKDNEGFGSKRKSKPTYMETTQGIWIDPPEVEKRKRVDKSKDVSFTQVIKSVEKEQADGGDESSNKIDEVLFAPSMPTDDDVKFENTPIKPIRKTSGNTAIIETLLRLKKEKGVVQKNSDIPPINRANIKDIDLDIKDKIIPKTDFIDIPSETPEEEKIRLLEQRRNRKIKDFILFDEEDEDEEDIFDPTVDDFTDYDQTTAIIDDISQLKGTLIARLCFLTLTAIFSIFIAVANDFGWPLIDVLNVEKQPTSYLFINLVLGVLSILVSYTVIQMGISRLAKLEPDADSVTAITVIVSMISGLMLLANPSFLQLKSVHVYIPFAILSLLINTVGKLLIVSRTDRNFKYISGEFDKYAVFNVEDEDIANKFTKGALTDFPQLTSIKRTEFANGFISNSYSSDIADRYSKIFLPILLIGSLIITVISFLFVDITTEVSEKVFIAFSTLAGTICLSSSLALMLVVNLPLSRASKKYLQTSSVMLGYSAVDDFVDTNSVIFDAGQLFPEGMVDIVNLKPTSNTSIEDGILFAASLACHSGSILKNSFYKMLKGKTEMLFPVESYIYEDSLGISGWIENKRVLLGTRELMENHSIEGIPTKAREAEYAKCHNILYLSVSGVVSTIFVVRINASVGVRRWMGELERNGITVVLRSVDGFLSLNLLSELFDVSPNSLKLLPFRFHADYQNTVQYSSNTTSSMFCSGKFHSLATLLVGAKRLYKVAAGGISLLMASAVVGGVISLVLTLLKSFSDISASVVIGYNIAWLVVIAILQRFRKV